MAVNSRSKSRSKYASKKSHKYVQSRLQIGPSEPALLKCTQCEMTYSPSALDDDAAHRLYHDMHLRGRKWSVNWGLEVPRAVDSNDVMPTPPSSSKNGALSSRPERIVMIRPECVPEVKATIEIMDRVNDELNAPHDENDFWSTAEGKGKAFLYIKNERAVGVATMEVLEPDRGRWMVYDTKSIIEHIKPGFVVGISRIWVCRTERHGKIATKILDAARENTIYGRCIDKWEVAWSQPTDSGGKLASKYNGVRHKSGKLLIPCYI